MRLHSAAVDFATCVFLTASFLNGQTCPNAQSGGGTSTLHAAFNPTVPSRIPTGPTTPPGVITTIPRPPVIPADQYQQQKSVPPRLPNGLPPGTASISPSGDPIVPARLPVQTIPTVSFQGIPETFLVQPPSPTIAVGPSDIMQIVNGNYIVRFTLTGQQTSQTFVPSWFAGTIFQTVCASNQNCVFGDVNVRYDQMHGRFLIVLQALDQVSGTSYLLLSVSNGATFDSGWTNWALNERMDGSTSSTNWADFPQVGLDNAAVYVTTNQFSFSAFTFQYAKVRIIRKSDLYNPATTTLPYQDIFKLTNADATCTPASTLQVPHLRGRTQAGTGAGVMINASDTPNATYFTLWQINNPTSNTPTVTRNTLNNVWAYSYPANAPQLGSTVPLDTGPSSFNQMILRDGLLYGGQNVGFSDQPTTVAYSVIDVLHNKVTLQQRFTNGNFFYPAFDVPASVGPGNVLPNNLIVGTTTDANGALTFAGVTNVKAGEDFYAPSDARWGDYFGSTIDPVTGGLWVSGEYAKLRVSGTPTWGTWNAFFPWSTSQAFNDVDSTEPNFNFINVMKLWNVTKGCSVNPPAFCPTLPVVRSSLAVFIIRSIFGDNFTFPQTPFFADVPATDPNFPYIQKMMEQGITQGCATNPAKFCPNDLATRRQAATFIIRGKLAGLFGDNFTFPATPFFTDVPMSDANFSFIQKFTELGYTNGCSASPAMFCPDSTLTREQAAVFIVRAFFN